MGGGGGTWAPDLEPPVPPPRPTDARRTIGRVVCVPDPKTDEIAKAARCGADGSSTNSDNSRNAHFAACPPQARLFMLSQVQDKPGSSRRSSRREACGWQLRRLPGAHAWRASGPLINIDALPAAAKARRAKNNARLQQLAAAARQQGPAPPAARGAERRGQRRAAASDALTPRGERGARQERAAAVGVAAGRRFGGEGIKKVKSCVGCARAKGRRRVEQYQGARQAAGMVGAGRDGGRAAGRRRTAQPPLRERRVARAGLGGGYSNHYSGANKAASESNAGA